MIILAVEEEEKGTSVARPRKVAALSPRAEGGEIQCISSPGKKIWLLCTLEEEEEENGTLAAVKKAAM